MRVSARLTAVVSWRTRAQRVARSVCRRRSRTLRPWSLSLSTLLDGADASASWVAFAERRGRLARRPEARDAAHGSGARDSGPALLGRRRDRASPRSGRGSECDAARALRAGTSLRELPETEQDLIDRPDPQTTLAHATGLRIRFDRCRRCSNSGPQRLVQRLRTGTTRLSSATACVCSRNYPGRPLTMCCSPPICTRATSFVRSEKPWLAIDPKPFVGDRAYDATQHLFNCRQRLLADADSTIRPLRRSAGSGCRTRPAVDVRARSGGAARRLD